MQMPEYMSANGPFTAFYADEIQAVMDDLSDQWGFPRQQLQFIDLSVYSVLGNGRLP